jgi:hypothetical protein
MANFRFYQRILGSISEFTGSIGEFPNSIGGFPGSIGESTKVLNF